MIKFARGLGWKSGKQTGTWFVHHNEFGPMVHYGDYLVILKAKIKVHSEEEWKKLLSDHWEEVLRKKEEQNAPAILAEAEKKNSILEILRESVKPFLFEGSNWSVTYKGGNGIEIQGIQSELFRHDYWNAFFEEISWALKFKGVLVARCQYSTALWEPTNHDLVGESNEVYGDFVGLVNKALEQEAVASTSDKKPRVSLGIITRKFEALEELLDGTTPFMGVFVYVRQGRNLTTYEFNLEGDCIDPPRKQLLEDPHAPHTKYDECGW